MQSSVIIIAIAILVLLTGIEADFCATGSKEIDGNWFCQPVKAIQYSNVGASGSYLQVIDMPPSGNCTQQPKAFSGPLAPLDEEVSLHFRGPLQLKQFAVYLPSPRAANAKRNRLAHQHGVAHKPLHKHHIAKAGLHAENKRQEIVATIDGQVVSWENTGAWDGNLAATQAPCAEPAEVTATIDGKVVSWVNNWFGGGASPACPATAAPTSTRASTGESALVSSSLIPTSDPIPAPASAAGASSKFAAPLAEPGVNGGSMYERVAYYDAASQTADNLTFLGNYGGAGSGVFDDVYGASLAYSNSVGTGGAESPQILADITIPSRAEVIIMAGQECGGNDCGYVRPGSIAYHGFLGADKVFLMEFSMPHDGQNGSESDMPAIWMLNAQIPRTVQYGSESCSCWESGCGEFDIAEALFEGSTYLKSTLHGNSNDSGGDSDYLERPTSGTMKLAVVFSSSSSSIFIQVLLDTTDFAASFSASEIDEICNRSGGGSVSDFTVT